MIKNACLRWSSVLSLPLITFMIWALVIAAAGQTVWTENSFDDFRDGTFLDAGSNLYVSVSGRVQMINRWDFNDDGHPDILLASGHGHTEKENMYIYVNKGGQIDGRNRIELPGGGSEDGVVADFNKDGYNDIAVANSADSHFSRVNAWIWFGSATGFSVSNRMELPAYRGKSIVAGDFNNDSWLDIAIACQWQAGTVTDPQGPLMSFIYWNSPEGFNAEKRLPLIFDGKGASKVVAGDLDNDNVTDLIALAGRNLYIFKSKDGAFENEGKGDKFAVTGTTLGLANLNGDEYKDLVLCTKKSVEIYPGTGDGFDWQKPRKMDLSNPGGLALADINKDGSDEIILAITATPGGATWTDSYVLFYKGDSLSLLNSIKLPTLGASAVSAGDLDQDGYPEVIFSNERITNQLNLNSYIYWNDKGRLYFGNHTQLPTLGTLGNAIGDINNDNLPDVLFFNEEGYFRDGPAKSYIYWGDGTRNFSTVRQTFFYTHHIFGQGHADLDDDGNVDLVLSQERFVASIPHEQNGLIVYWGTGKSFSPPSWLTMSTAYGGVRIADINKDGYLDLLAGGAMVDLAAPETHGIPIFWGSDIGFTRTNVSILHHEIEKMRAPLLMDLNKDGWLDIAGQVENGKVRIWWGAVSGFGDDNYQELDLGRKDHLMYIKGADFNKDGWLDLVFPKRVPHEAHNTSFIYYGSATGYSNENRTEVMANIPYECSIADFDKDGWLDLFMPSYGTDLSGNRNSVIHWGSAEGFDKRPYSEFKTFGASGSDAIDYDGDGWLDLLVANHRKAGSVDKPEPHLHTTISMLYWGGPDGFSDENRWEVEASGPSGLNVRDPGNSYDRGLYEDYISSVYHIPDTMEPAQITWQADTPGETEVHFQVRSAQDESGLETKPWLGPDGVDTWFRKPSSIEPVGEADFIQYRARLISPNGAQTPYLKSVSIEFR